MANINMKGLLEKRAALITELEGMLSACETETRAFNEEEAKRYGEISKEIGDIDATLDAAEKAGKLDGETRSLQQNQQETTEEVETRAFAAWLRGGVENRADTNMTYGDNGAVIPSTIAAKIIQKVHDICPIYQRATRYNLGGTLNIPYVDEDAGEITMAYQDEFTELESSALNLKSIALTGYLSGVLSKVSKSLINNSQFDIVSFVVRDMADKISRWLEGELLNGTDGKIAGLTGVTKTVTAAAGTAVTGDELIDVQDAVPDVYQANAVWIMSRATRSAIRKLKDGEGNYLLNKDFTGTWGYTLLGKPVFVSENMADMEAGKTAIYYGDLSGLAVKVSEQINTQVLREKYATQHAVGVVGWMEVDSKVENAQKIAKLVMAG